MPPWVSDWVGIPHVKRGRLITGADCLGLFILLSRHRRNVEIPDPFCTMAQAVRRDEARRNRDLYEQVSSPIEGDAILMRASGHPIHVGYCVNHRFMLHSEDEAGSVVERWDGSKWKNRVEGVFRYVG